MCFASQGGTCASQGSNYGSVFCTFASYKETIFSRSLHQNCASQNILCLATRWLDGNTFRHPASWTPTSYSQVQHEADVLSCLRQGKRVVELFDYYEKREHSLMVLEYLQVRQRRGSRDMRQRHPGRRAVCAHWFQELRLDRGKVQEVSGRLFG